MVPRVNFTLSSPESWLLYSPSYFIHLPVRLQSRYFVALILIALLILNCSCIKGTRVVANDNFYIINKKGEKLQRKGDRGASFGSKKAPPSESIYNVIKTQSSNKKTNKGKTELINANVLEEQDPAVAALLNEAKTDSQNAEIHFNLAVIYHRYRIFDKAYEEYQKAIRVHPTNAIYFESVGRLWRDWGAPQLGINDLQKALQLQPEFVEAWNSLGTVYDALGDFIHAQQSYLKALEFNPGMDFVHSNLCFSYLQTGDLLKAIFHGEEAVRLNLGLKVAHNNLGLVYGMEGQFDRAFEEFKLAGDEAGAHNNLGIVLLKKQRIAEAMEQFKMAAKLRPFFKIAVENYYLAQSLKFGIERNLRRQAVRQKQDTEVDTAISEAQADGPSGLFNSQSNAGMDFITRKDDYFFERMTTSATVLGPKRQSSLY